MNYLVKYQSPGTRFENLLTGFYFSKSRPNSKVTVHSIYDDETIHYRKIFDLYLLLTYKYDLDMNIYEYICQGQK